MEYTWKRAELKDLDELVETRITVLRAANKLSDDEDMDEVRRQTEKYYLKALVCDEHIAYLVYDGDKFIGAGGVSFYEVMPTYHNPSGKKAYVMNMYTDPEYRRQGIAYKTLDKLVGEANALGVTAISLEATEAGRPLYEKYGFIKMNDEMELVDNRIDKAIYEAEKEIELGEELMDLNEAIENLDEKNETE